MQITTKPIPHKFCLIKTASNIYTCITSICHCILLMFSKIWKSSLRLAQEYTRKILSPFSKRDNFCRQEVTSPVLETFQKRGFQKRIHSKTEQRPSKVAPPNEQGGRYFYAGTVDSLSWSPRDSEILQDIRYPYFDTYQICRTEEKINRKTTCHKWICNLTPEVRDILKYIMEKRRHCALGVISFPQYFVTCC